MRVTRKIPKEADWDLVTPGLGSKGKDAVTLAPGLRSSSLSTHYCLGSILGSCKPACFSISVTCL